MKTHIVHYLKVKLTKDISLRYFFNFEDQPSRNGTWVIKSHDRKEYASIDARVAKLIAESHGKTLDNHVEIIGRSISDGVYQKVIIKNKNGKHKVKVLIEDY